MVRYLRTLGMNILVSTLRPTCWVGNKCAYCLVSLGKEREAVSSHGGQSENVEGERQRGCSSLLAPWDLAVLADDLMP